MATAIVPVGPALVYLPLVSGQYAESRGKYSPVFRQVVNWTSGLIVFSVIATLVVMYTKGNDADATAMFVRLIQISFGMVLGTACVFFGVVVSWLGITASYKIAGSGEVAGSKGSLSFQNASPGIILILAGSVLIGLSLYKPVHHESSTTTYSNDVSIQRKLGAAAKNQP